MDPKAALIGILTNPVGSPEFAEFADALGSWIAKGGYKPGALDADNNALPKDWTCSHNQYIFKVSKGVVVLGKPPKLKKYDFAEKTIQVKAYSRKEALDLFEKEVSKGARFAGKSVTIVEHRGYIGVIQPLFPSGLYTYIRNPGPGGSELNRAHCSCGSEDVAKIARELEDHMRAIALDELGPVVEPRDMLAAS